LNHPQSPSASELNSTYFNSAAESSTRPVVLHLTPNALNGARFLKTLN